MLEFDFKKRDKGIPVLSKKEIDIMAEQLLADYDPKLLKKPTRFDIELFTEAYVGLDMDYLDITPDQSMLGAMVFTDGDMPFYNFEKGKWDTVPAKEGTVIIDNSLLAPDQLRRGRFTLGHELGHWICHRHMYLVNKDQMTIFDLIGEPSDRETFKKCRFTDIENPSNKLETDDDWIEWHADYMGSALLMPKTTFQEAASKMLEEVGIKKGYYVLGTNNDVDLWAWQLPRNLADIFDVSIAAATIRLKKLGIIVEPQNGPN